MPVSELALEIVAEVKKIPEFAPLKTKQRRFLAIYAQSLNVLKSAKLAGISFEIHYWWLANNPQYRLAFEKAQEIAGDIGEADVYERAFIGTDKTKTITRGDQVITESWKQKSDLLAMFSLKKLKPQYRDNPQLAIQVNNHPPEIHFHLTHAESSMGRSAPQDVGAMIDAELSTDNPQSNQSTSDKK